MTTGSDGQPAQQVCFAFATKSLNAIDPALTAEMESENNIMQQMMDAAFAAKDEESAEKRQAAVVEAKKSFSKGMKRGFLGGAPKPKSATKPKSAAKQPATAAAAAVPSSSTSPTSSTEASFEVGTDGAFDLDAMPQAALPPAEDVSHIKAAAGGSSAPVLPEVQAALKEQLGEFGTKLVSGEWMTADLQSRIFQNPRLMAGMSNPKCQAALQEFQAKPEEAMKKYANDATVRDFLTEFFGIMGDHFTQMGQGEKEGGAAPGADGGTQPQAAAAAAAASSTGLTARSTTRVGGDTAQAAGGPAAASTLEGEKLRKQAKAMAQAAQRGDIAKEDEEVRAVMSDPEVLQLLMDPGMQRVLEECRQQPQRLPMYMRNPTMRENLMRLQKAGLIKIV